MRISQEKKWQAEADIRTLAEAEEIKADKPRLSTAKKVVVRIVREKQKELKAVQKVAKSPARKRTASRKSSKRK